MSGNLSLSEFCQSYKTSPYIISPQKQLSYTDLYTYSAYLFNILKQRGICAQERVAILSENKFHTALLLLALFRLGVIAVPLSIRLPMSSILTMLQNINCTNLLISKKYVKSKIKDDLSFIVIEEIFPNEVSNKSVDAPAEIPLDQESTIVFTSGTGAKPKAVLHSIGNHYFSALGSNSFIPLKKEDRWLISLPLNHVGGVSILFRTLLAGATAVCADEKKPLIENILINKITHVSLVATQFYRLLKEIPSVQKLQKLKAILLGGGPISENLIKSALQLKLPIYLSYGSSEMSSQITTASASDLRKNFRTSGKTLKYRFLKINADNQILVKGPTLFRGYVKQDIISLKKKNGWFCSGDLGHLNDRGYLTVLGRKNNMFISGGENISADEIKNTLNNFSNIVDSEVVDIPDEEFGARPVAFIKVSPKTKFNEKECITYLKQKLPSYMIPLYFFRLPDKFNTMKVSRKKLREMALNKIANQ
jgi:O-succinylbenzoic acid--CoA ligase